MWQWRQHSFVIATNQNTTRTIRPLVALLTIALATSPAYAGAWLQRDNHGQFINQLSYYSSSEYFDHSGHRSSQPSFNKLEYQPYVEYGLTRRYTIGGTALVQQDWQGGANNTGIADPEIFLRARLYHDPSQVLSLQPLLKLPSLFIHDATTPRGGSHSTDGELSLLYGHNFSLLSSRDYVDTRIGYRARSHGLNNQYRADAAIGLSPAQNWQIIPAMRYVKAAKLVPDQPFSETGEQDYDLLKAELAVAYRLDTAQSVHAAYFNDIYGKQTGVGQGITLGYAVNF